MARTSATARPRSLATHALGRHHAPAPRLSAHLEQPAFNTTIENDLRLAVNDGLDKLILDAIAASGFQAPGTDPLLVSIRKAITTIPSSKARLPGTAPIQHAAIACSTVLTALHTPPAASYRVLLR
jgi:hypothetical protein